MATFLATGFVGVDSRPDAAACVDCLRFLGGHPDMRAIKDESLGLLDLTPGSRVLEVGCGLGREARTMAGLVGDSGLAVGLDASRLMLAHLTEGVVAVGGAVPRPVAGDACRLPFAADCFDACRVERTLQHLDDPASALAAMARVTRPGGTVLALEPDWGTFVVDSALRDVSRSLAASWCDSFRSGWIGRRLAGLMAEAGLGDVVVRPRSLVVRDLEAAEAIYNLLATAERAVATGGLAPKDASDFQDEQRGRDKHGRFFCSLTFFLVTGNKPA